MPTSSSTNNTADVPESVARAIESFGQGQTTLPEVRARVAEALEGGPECAEAIHELLDEELKSRHLSIADYGELVGVVGAVASENVPTEWSEDAQNEPGVYRVVEEGTLVLAENGLTDSLRLPATPEDESTRPFDQDLAQPVDVVLETIEPGTVLRDRYRLDAEVARGAMGVVYRATDLIKLEAGAADPQLAIKVVSPEFADDINALRAFQNEVANTQHLSHPNIVHLFELDRDGDRHFITMEWLEGRSLAALLDNSHGSALEPAQTYAIIEQLCDALMYAHEHNVVHADVKPGNVFLLDTGEVKLIDFGIAKSEAGWGDTNGESSDPIALTPAYASCERLEKAEPTPQDDLYSLACLIYRLLAGRRVFGPLTALEAEADNMELVPIGGIDDNRWNAVAVALSFRREDRQNSIRDFVTQFGKRATVRDADVAALIDDTSRMPVLDVEQENELVDVAELRSEIDVDFAFEEDAAEEPEPELSGVFAAAANGEAGLDVDFTDVASESAADEQGEDIVLETAPAAESVTLEELSGQREPAVEVPAAVEPAGVIREPVSGGLSQAQKQWVGGAIAALVLVVVGVMFFSGSDEPIAERKVTTPTAAAVEPAVVPATDVDAESVIAAERDELDSPPELQAEQSAPEPTDIAAPIVPAAVVAAAPDVPVVAEPVVAESAIAEPVVAEPVVAVPVIAAPVVAEAAIAEPVVVEPVIAEPVAAESAGQDPVITSAEPDGQAEQELSVSDVELAAAATVTIGLDGADAPSADLAAPAPASELPSAPVAETAAESAINETELVAASGLGALVAAAVEQGSSAAPAGAPIARVAEEPAAPVFDPREPVQLSELEFVKYAEPKFPRSPDGRNYDGWVDVEFRVGTDGKTRNIEVIGSDLPTRFEGPSINAVKKWRFEPYEVNGAPVAVFSAVRLRFAN